MIDIRHTIVAKSDQLNSDDLIGRPLTIKITKTLLVNGDQPVAIHYEGDNGKPWKPCKSMRRVLVGVWGGDASTYAGRSLTLYRDDSVSFGGSQVGGIRISHMSHINADFHMPLTVSRSNRKKYTVKPLGAEYNTQQPATAAIPEDVPSVEDCISDIESAPTLAGLEFKYKSAFKIYASSPDDLSRITEAKDKRKAQLAEGAAA